MWIMLNDCFISIVSKDCAADELMVRARRPGDLEKLFPKAKVTEFTGSDYHYRTPVKRTALAEVLVAELARVTYANFKDSVDDRKLHDAYLSVWHTMARLQPNRPYSGRGMIARSGLFDHIGIEDLDKRAPAQGKKKSTKKAAGK